MPFVKPPGIIPYIDKSILAEFTYKAINCRPEAPWIKRCEYGIKFTEEIKSTIDSVDSEEPKPILVGQEQYEKMHEEYDNVKIKAKSQVPVEKTLSFANKKSENVKEENEGNIKETIEILDSVEN